MIAGERVGHNSRQLFPESLNSEHGVNPLLTRCAGALRGVPWQEDSDLPGGDRAVQQSAVPGRRDFRSCRTSTGRVHLQMMRSPSQCVAAFNGLRPESARALGEPRQLELKSKSVANFAL